MSIQADIIDAMSATANMFMKDITASYRQCQVFGDL